MAIFRGGKGTEYPGGGGGGLTEPVEVEGPSGGPVEVKGDGTTSVPVKGASTTEVPVKGTSTVAVPVKGESTTAVPVSSDSTLEVEGKVGGVPLPISSGSPLEVTNPSGGALDTKDRFFEVTKGLVSGRSHVNVNGGHSSVSSFAFSTLTEIGSFYTYSASAVTLYISSSSASDTQSFEITGLDASKAPQTATVTLAGTTKTAITGTWTRVFSVVNKGTTDNLGDVYVYEDDTPVGGVPPTLTKVRAKVLVGDNKSRMALYTIPTGKTGYLQRIRFARGLWRTASVKLLAKDETGPFRVELFEGVGRGDPALDIPYKVMPKFTEKTDIEARALYTELGTGLISCTFDLILVDN